MAFDMNLAFKIIPFVTGDFDGKDFKKATTGKAFLNYAWLKFWIYFTVSWAFLRKLWCRNSSQKGNSELLTLLFQIFDFFRYVILASIREEHSKWEFYL